MRVMIWSCLHQEVSYISTYFLSKYRRSNNSQPEFSHAQAIMLLAVTDDIHLHCWCTMIVLANATVRLYRAEAKRIKCDINTASVVYRQTSSFIRSISTVNIHKIQWTVILPSKYKSQTLEVIVTQQVESIIMHHCTVSDFPQSWRRETCHFTLMTII